MAAGCRRAGSARGAEFLDCPDRNGFGIGRRLRANLPGLANRRRLARGIGVWRGMEGAIDPQSRVYWLRRGSQMPLGCPVARYPAKVELHESVAEESHGSIEGTARHSGLPGVQDARHADGGRTGLEVRDMQTRLSRP